MLNMHGVKKGDYIFFFTVKGPEHRANLKSPSHISLARAWTQTWRTSLREITESNLNVIVFTDCLHS